VWRGVAVTVWGFGCDSVAGLIFGWEATAIIREKGHKPLRACDMEAL
jgi:hypothetical protein